MDMKLSDSSVYCAVANTSVATEIKRKDEQQANVTSTYFFTDKLYYYTTVCVAAYHGDRSIET